ncbi:MAG: ECF transporter S component [Provencibacterium sp.]|jgi:riboflavin transporter FmnP|nr:ECF transporter S component [Provencibacterium sp.]
MSNEKTRIKTITYTALFAAISTVLMFWSFPLPFMPPFLKLDLSGVPILLCAFMFGPVPGLMAAAIKNLINAAFSTSGGIGELADFLILGSFAATAALVYRRKHTRRGALIACAAASGVMVVVGMLANRFLLIPFYMQLMPIEKILSMCAAVNPMIGSLNTYVLFGAGPFNLVKALVLSLITFLLYKRLHLLILRESAPVSTPSGQGTDGAHS